MSASREKKVRGEQDSLTQKVTKKEKKKLSEGWIFAICIVAVVALLFGGLFIARSVRGHQRVLTVGDYKVEAGEFNYFYRELASGLDQNAQFLGIQKDVPLNEQKVSAKNSGILPMLGLDTSCLEGKEPVDDFYDVSWAEIIADTAWRRAASTYAVYQEAVKNGYQVSEEEAASIDEGVEFLDTIANQQGMSTNEYLQRLFGRGSTGKNYRHYLEVVQTAGSYRASLQYTEEELAARYEKEPEKFDTAEFYFYSVDAASLEAADKSAAEEDSEKEEKAETEDKPEKDYEAEAKAAAEKMAEDFDLSSDKVDIRADITRENAMGMVHDSEEACNWIYKDAKEGEVKMFTVKSDEEDGKTTYIVLKMIGRGTYNTSNYLTISVPADPEDKELKEGELTAQQKVDAIKASLDADGSEENFRKNMREYAHADGSEYDAEKEGLRENVTHASMAYKSKEFYTWATAKDQKSGWTMIKENGGTTFYFYLGEGKDHQKLVVNEVLINEWYTDVTDAAIAAADYNKDAFMDTANVAYYLS